MYFPASDFQDYGSRWDFFRTPQAICMLACELCGAEMDTRKELLKHLETYHVPSDGEGARASWWTANRVVEEYRKRLVCYEQEASWTIEK